MLSLAVVFSNAVLARLSDLRLRFATTCPTAVAHTGARGRQVREGRGQPGAEVTQIVSPSAPDLLPRDVRFGLSFRVLQRMVTSRRLPA